MLVENWSETASWFFTINAANTKGFVKVSHVPANERRLCYRMQAVLRAALITYLKNNFRVGSTIIRTFASCYVPVEWADEVVASQVFQPIIDA